MDNIKMGSFIREARKKKGLTQKDIATHLHITDRAVSKWERGICAPDLALLEPLADILGVTITELISSEYQINDSNKEELENAVKETISYSKQEISKKKKAANKKLIVGFIAVLLGIVLILGILWYQGFFHVVGKYPSPDGTVITTVYDCKLEHDAPPASGGFTLSDKGYFQGRTIYENAVFRGLWWSPDNSYQVVSMYTDGEIWLAMSDYTRNSHVNLTHRLENALYENEFFSNVPYDDEGWRPEISFEFIQWSNVDPSVMLVYFSYTDVQGEFHEGYMWYDYESGQPSGEMEIEQGEKDSYWLNDVIDDLF